MEKATSDLSSELSRATVLENFKEFHEKNKEHFAYPDPLNYLLEISQGHGVEKKELIKTVINQSILERAYVYHLVSGEKSMNRDKYILFSLAGQLNLEEVNELLKYAGQATLYIRNKRDAAIEFSFRNHLSIIDTNSVLEELNLEIVK